MEEIVLDKRIHAVYLCSYYKLQEHRPERSPPTTKELRLVFLSKGPEYLEDVFWRLWRKTRGNELPPKYTPIRDASRAATYLRERGINLATLPDKKA